MAGRRSKRDKILEVAAKLFAEKGPSEVTMDEVAAAVPVSKMTIYNHFGTKDGLLDAVIRHAADREIEEFFRLVESAGSFEQAIAAISHYDRAGASALSRRFVLDLMNNYPEKAQGIMGLYENEIEPRVEAMIFEAQREGFVRRDLSAHVIVRFIRCMKEFFSRPDMFKDVGDMEFVLNQVLEIFYRGILVR